MWQQRMPSRTCFSRFSQDIRVEESIEATTDQYTYSDIRAYNGSRTPIGHDKREMPYKEDSDALWVCIKTESRQH
jgi:hypothetical protein